MARFLFASNIFEAKQLETTLFQPLNVEDLQFSLFFLLFWTDNLKTQVIFKTYIFLSLRKE